MSAPAIAVRPEASVWLAWKLMAHHGVRHLLVTENGRCIGVLDDRTLFAQWPLGPAALHNKPVSALMRRAVTCVPASRELRCAADVMMREGVDAVPVVDESGVTVGIVSYRDILGVFARCGAELIDPAQHP